MAYEKHTWQTGQVITANKLNNIQDGIGGGVYKVNLTLQGDGSEIPYYYETDKTWQEIADAFDAGQKCLIQYSMNTAYGTLQSTALIYGKYIFMAPSDMAFQPQYTFIFRNLSPGTDIYGVNWSTMMSIKANANNQKCSMSTISD